MLRNSNLLSPALQQVFGEFQLQSVKSSNCRILSWGKAAGEVQFAGLVPLGNSVEGS